MFSQTERSHDEPLSREERQQHARATTRRAILDAALSLFVGIIATLVSLLIGVSYGAIAGYVGGRLDNIMMRIVDVLYSLPYVIVVIVLLSMKIDSTAPLR